MIREVVRRSGSPPSSVPLSPAVKANGVVYCSGQLPINPETGPVASTDIKLQTRQVLNNLASVLEAAGSDLGAGPQSDRVYDRSFRLFTHE
jgi:2-iminobutanoate/2-iminopropanoate deaminase